MPSSRHFFIAIFRLPVAVVAGAALAGTFATSVIGVIVYSVLSLPGGGHAAPDWWLVTLFGMGGLAGMYLGAATQKHVPQRVPKLGLGLLLAGLGGSYLWPMSLNPDGISVFWELQVNSTWRFSPFTVSQAPCTTDCLHAHPEQDWELSPPNSPLLSSGLGSAPVTLRAPAPCW